MILAIWLKGTLLVLDKQDISENYNRYEDENYKSKVLRDHLRSVSFDWECMDYGSFDSMADMEAHMKRLSDEKLEYLREIQERLKGTERSS